MRMPWEITREMFLSFQEVDTLLAHVRARAHQAIGRDETPAMLDRVIVETLLFSGVRSTELCKLSLADTVLGDAEPRLCVRGQRKEDRTVYVPAHLAELLRTYVAHVRPQLLPEGTSPRDPVRALLYSEHRQPYERTGLYRRVVRILTEAGLGDRASVQLLRHTYGYLAYARTNGNLLFVQRQLGHAHPMVTAIYSQFVDESYADMANLVADATRPGGRPANRATQRKGSISWRRTHKSRKS